MLTCQTDDRTQGVARGRFVWPSRPPLKGSLAYLRLLKPNYDKGLSLSDLPFLRKGRQLLNNERAAESRNHPLPRVKDEAEPLQDRVRHEIFNFSKVSLNVEEHRNYARASVST